MGTWENGGSMWSRDDEIPPPQQSMVVYSQEAYDNAFARARVAMLNPLVRTRVEEALKRTGTAIARMRGAR